jgi:hypothetical protein
MDNTTFMVSPDKDYFGLVPVSVTAKDDSGGTWQVWFNLNVKNIDDAPEFFLSIPDTSIQCNGDAHVRLRSFLKDVDDSLSSLKIRTLPIAGITTAYDDYKIELVLSPISFIDTAVVTIIATDTSGLSDTSFFRFFANRPVPLDTSFTIRCTQAFTPSTIYYPQYQYSAWIEGVNDSNVDIWGLMNNKLFYDTYNIHGQKCRTTPMITPQCNFTEISRLSANRIFAYCGNINANGLWRYVLLDSNLVLLNAYESLLYNPPVHTAAEASGKIFIFGRQDLSASKCLFVDVFDTNLTYIRSDTVSQNGYRAEPVRLFPQSDGYTVFWTNDINGPQFLIQLFGGSFSFDGQKTRTAKAILPYISKASQPPLIYSVSPYIISRKSGHFLVLWRFDNATSLGASAYSVSYGSTIYGLDIDQNIALSGNYSIVNDDSTPFRSSTIEYAWESANKLLMFWRNAGGNGDPIYRYNRAFRTDLTPMTPKFSDGQLLTGYAVLNDTIVFRLDRNNDGKLKATFLRHFQDTNQTLVHRYSKEAIIGSYHILGSGVICLYDLRGKRICPENGAVGLKGLNSQFKAGLVIARTVSGRYIKKMVIH